MRFVLLVALFLCSCAQPVKDFREGNRVHPDFVYYVEFYESKFNKEVYNIPVTYKQLSGNYAGRCFIQYNGLSEIFINPNYWETASDLQRKAVIIHELIHCDRRVNKHRNFLLEDSCSGSIMHSYLPNSWCLEKHWTCYLEEVRKDF